MQMRLPQFIRVDLNHIFRVKVWNDAENLMF